MANQLPPGAFPKVFFYLVKEMESSFDTNQGQKVQAGGGGIMRLLPGANAHVFFKAFF